jgi:hypothetical protein
VGLKHIKVEGKTLVENLPYPASGSLPHSFSNPSFGMIRPESIQFDRLGREGGNPSVVGCQNWELHAAVRGRCMKAMALNSECLWQRAMSMLLDALPVPPRLPEFEKSGSAYHTTSN